MLTSLIALLPLHKSSLNFIAHFDCIPSYKHVCWVILTKHYSMCKWEYESRYFVWCVREAHANYVELSLMCTLTNKVCLHISSTFLSWTGWQHCIVLVCSLTHWAHCYLNHSFNQKQNSEHKPMFQAIITWLISAIIEKINMQVANCRQWMEVQMAVIMD